MAERRGAEETRGASEGAAAGAGQRERQRASGEGTSYLQGTNGQKHGQYLLFLNDTSHMCVLSQYVTQTVEVESPATLKHLTKARQRNELLSEKLANQNERCKQLEEQIRKSDEYSCNLQHKVPDAADSGLTSLA